MEALPEKLINTALGLALSSVLMLFICLGVSFIKNEAVALVLGEIFSTICIAAFFSALFLGFVLIILNIVYHFKDL